MTGIPASLSGLALAGCAFGLGFPAVTSAAQASSPTAAMPVQTGEPHFDFDIPAQPLNDALQRYGAVARQPALYRSEIVTGQISTAVRGRYSPEAALHLLLEGTGLSAERFDMGQSSAFILKAASDSVAAPVANGLGDRTGYPGLVQTRVWQALCANPLTAPGRYRAVLRFQLDAAGHVERPRLIGSTGDTRRDTAVLETLRDIRMDAAPPNDMPQPVTLLLLPRDAEFGLPCDAAAGGRAGS
ncbi:TonB family protein [Pandoraea sp. PE-S2T-3]|uniref:TonB family protein n=1 Tax=Pandoraea sp. PE-S2T-3 TaxID=1986993 RepID=UPI000B406E85|nr:TonB family protein [Pandoraea sp. PE-S2T-3]